jgi:hypothetical protein
MCAQSPSVEEVGGASSSMSTMRTGCASTGQRPKGSSRSEACRVGVRSEELPCRRRGAASEERERGGVEEW